MNKEEYESLQNQFSAKLRNHTNCCGTKSDDIYNEAVLACKSILHQYYKYHNDNGNFVNSNIVPCKNCAFQKPTVTAQCSKETCQDYQEWKRSRQC